MDQATRTRLERNVFHAAQQACEPWENFSWHPSAYEAHSSQALCIDVFGTIKTSANRDKIVDALAKTIGLPTGGPWDITLEWTARQSLLKEPHPTQVDVYAESPHSIMLFECVFTEPAGDACSQTMQRKLGASCDGNYGDPINPEHDMTSRCVLSEKGIQYWDIIPKVFHLDAHADYQPCPFAGSAYQWMRNLVVAYKVGRQKNKQPAVVIVYADNLELPMVQTVRSREWEAFTKTVRKDHMSLHVHSYQEILMLAEEVTQQDGGETILWQELGDWVKRKIAASQGGRRKPTRKRSSSKAMASSRNG